MALQRGSEGVGAGWDVLIKTNGRCIWNLEGLRSVPLCGAHCVYHRHECFIGLFSSLRASALVRLTVHTNIQNFTLSQAEHKKQLGFHCLLWCRLYVRIGSIPRPSYAYIPTSCECILAKHLSITLNLKLGVI
jgi:hypothetical protein